MYNVYLVSFMTDLNLILSELHENGFVILKNALNDTHIKSILAEYERICSQRQEEASAALKANGMNSRLVNAHLESLPIAQAFNTPSLLQLADAFFAGRKAMIYSSLYFQDGTNQPLHRDAPVFCTFPENLFLGCWFALEDATISNGALMGVKQSNKLFHDELQMRYKFGVDRLKEVDEIPFSDPVLWNQYQKFIQNKLVSEEMVSEPIEATAGDIIVWHPLFVHGGIKHDSGKTRHSIVMHVIPQNIEVHGSYLFFAPQNPLTPRVMNTLPIGDSTRVMKRDICKFGNDNPIAKQYS